MTHVITNTEHLHSTIDAAIDRVGVEITAVNMQMRENARPHALRCAHLNLDPSWFARTFLGKSTPTQAELEAYADGYLDKTVVVGFRNAGWVGQMIMQEKLSGLQDDEKDLISLKKAAESVGAESFQVPVKLFNLLKGD